MANVATISITEELRPAEVQLTKDGTAWMRALVHVGRLSRAVHAAECRPRACKRCGAEFAPRYPHQRTCDGCLGR